MKLKLQYAKLTLAILALLACFCFNVYAQSSTTIGNDTVVVTIKDENNNSVSLYLPESMNNDQCERRIYGTPTGVIGMFKTLYSEERRTESYEAAIRELCMQPGASQSYIGHLEKSLQSVGVASEDANFVLDLVKYGADSINKKYIKGGTLTADAHNRLAKVGRKLNAAQKSPAFAQACIAFENVKATAKLTETITGAFLLNSLSTDQAWIRLKEIEGAVDSERQAQGKVDPALKKAINQSEINLLAAQSKIGAFAVSVNDNLQEITDSAVSLGATLADISAKFSAPVAMWVGAPLMAYNTLRGVSDQWEMAQDGVSLATVTKMVEKYSQGRESATDNITSYGQYAFYSQMEETFSVGEAKLHDLLSPGSANKDWSQYYKQEKKNTVVIAIDSDENPTPSPALNTFISTNAKASNYNVARITDSKGSILKVSQLRFEYDAQKKSEFFNFWYGRVKLSIPFKYIKRIRRWDLENPRGTLCSVELQSGISFVGNKIGYSWQGKNQFGGDYFIYGDDWRVVDFEHYLGEHDNIQKERESSVLVIDWENVFHIVTSIHYEYAPRQNGDFFNARVGDSLIKIPFAKISYVLMTNNDNELCEVRTVDGEILKCTPSGYSWGGNNEFGGEFFIYGSDWQAICFNRNKIPKTIKLPKK